jgi:methylase of polypeptide subunit release factors
MMTGQPARRSQFEDHLPPGAVDELVRSGLGVEEGDRLNLAITIVEIAGVLAVIPKHPWGDHVVYLGPDSAHLIEAAFRLARRGRRAADLGTGTGLHAALLGRRYETVVATDCEPSVVAAADLTLALNHFPPGHQVSVCLADVAQGLRPAAFDLVTANAPWVPLAENLDAPRELFAHGGATGVELPGRFLLEGASLLRPGGVAITLALDVTLGPSSREALAPTRPLQAITAALENDGFAVAMLPTPFNRQEPRLFEIMHKRQPRLQTATHVAVVVARPFQGADGRGSLMVAAEALREHWAHPPAPLSVPG